MGTDKVTIEQFIRNHRIGLRVIDHVDRNPNMEDVQNMDHWKVCLVRGKRRMTIYFSKGFGHGGDRPKAAELLECLASDTAGIENYKSDFATWCGEYGYDTDSRKAERTFDACLHAAGRLKRFLGDDLYEQLLWNTEAI